MTKNNTNKIESKAAAAISRAVGQALSQPKQKKGKGKGNGKGRGKMGGVPRAPAQDLRLMALASLIRDPCNSKIDNIPGATGETIIRRIRTQITLHEAAAYNNGYLLWFPEYHGSASRLSTGSNCNMFAYEQTVAGVGVRPTNTAVAPLGGGAATGISGTFLKDPVSAIVSGDTTAYGAACTLAACMTFLYSGTTSDNAGFVYGVEDIAPSIFFNNQGGAAGSANGAVSIQVLTSYAKTRMRTPLEGMEIVVRPKRYVFRGPGSDTGTLAQFGAVDTLFGIGGAGAQSTLVASDANLVAGFGIAWTGLSAPLSNVSMECIKVVELSIRPTEGIIEETATVPPGPSIIEEAVEFLDKTTPGWQTRLAHGASTIAANIANIALAGAANTVMRSNAHRLLH